MIVLDLSLLFDGVLFCLPFCWCPCMAINVSVQYDGGFLRDIILLIQCYYHRGTRLNAMKRFCTFSYRSHLNVLTCFPPGWGCSEGLGAFRFFFKHDKRRMRPQDECFVRSVVLDAHDFG